MSTAHDPLDLSRAPEAPQLPHRLRLYRGQWLGLPILIAIPLLACLNLFGEQRAQVQSAAADLQIDVEYPRRMRVGQRTQVLIHVRNTSGRALESVTLTVDPTYLGHVAGVTLAPEPLEYDVQLTALEPREARLVRAEIEGQRAGFRQGWLRATFVV